MSPTPCNFHILNCWSKAGIGTSIILAFGDPTTNGPSSARVALDLGATPAFGESVPASVVLLSHGHIDHIGAIFSHARAHTLSFSGSVPTYHVPKQILPLVQAAKEAMIALNAAGGDRKGATLEMNLIGVEPGDEVVLPFQKHLKGKDVIVRVFATSHAGCPSVGYVISTRRREKVLRAEFRDLPADKIRDLARSGVVVKEDVVEETFDVMYTGDTTFEALETNAELWSRCHTIFCEVTYLDATDKSRVMARDRGHMHIDDVVQLLNLAGENQRLILIHISGRYSAQQALNFLTASIPNQSASRVEVAVLSLSGSSRVSKIARKGLVALSAYAREQKAQVSNKGRTRFEQRQL